jgi:hypothetical protein
MKPSTNATTQAYQGLLLTASRVTPLWPLYHSHLISIGDRHLRRGRNCQDHALARAVSAGAVFCVADGASNYEDDRGATVPSHNEAGAIIVAEVAVTAALAGVAAGLDGDAVHQLVCTELAASLRHLWRILGSRGQGVLGTTLLLGVVTPEWSRIWASGDGEWGLYLPRRANLGNLRGPNLLDTQFSDGTTSVRGGCHTPRLKGTAACAARKGGDAVAEAFPVALAFDGPVLGGWIATDGLRDEPELQAQLRRTPPRDKTALEAVLRRPSHCDDLGIAWAVTPCDFNDEVFDA